LKKKDISALFWGCHGRDRRVVGFTTTYAISAYHHWCCEFESRSGLGGQHYVIKFVCDLRQVIGFLQVHRFPPPIKLTATIYSTLKDILWWITFRDGLPVMSDLESTDVYWLHTCCVNIW